MKQKTYLAIDLKSFYASVECKERDLDPLNTNLVVADDSRTDKTICLAVSPSLKAFGIPGRPRLFEVKQKIKEINTKRLYESPDFCFHGGSIFADELQDPTFEVNYITAPPRMALYIEYSARIYDIYVQYFAPEDIHVYSIDEVFIDCTGYLNIYGMNAHDLARKVIQEVLDTTGITATVGIGTNLYLSKVAMDIVAKHIPADQDGVRIASLDEISYRQQLWEHQPLTDFWRVGKGYARKLTKHGLYTMGDIALCSLTNEDFLFQIFGKNAELLIDHAWGHEPCTIQDIKSYRPEAKSLGSGQVLHRPYTFLEAQTVLWEMADNLSLDLVDKQLVTKKITITIGYDIENLIQPELSKQYTGPIKIDAYGRKIPEHAHGTIHLDTPSSSGEKICNACQQLYQRIVDPHLLIRRIQITVHDLCHASTKTNPTYKQVSLFEDVNRLEKQEKKLQDEKKIQETLIKIKKKYGKNAILKGTNLKTEATQVDRNNQIGGHKA